MCVCVCVCVCVSNSADIYMYTCTTALATTAVGATVLVSKYRIAPNFRKIAKNPMIENFRDKNFVIATFIRDYHRTAASMRTIHVVALPGHNCIACGSALG